MELLNSVSFWVISILLIISSLLTVLLPKLLYSVFAAFVSFFFLGLLFFSLNSPFNAAVQISVYAVAVIILLVLGIMLTNQFVEKKRYLIISSRLFLTFIGIIMILFAIISIFRHDFYYEIIIPFYSIINTTDPFNSVQILSYQLFTKYILVFELASVLLLSGIIGISALLINNERSNGDV